MEAASEKQATDIVILDCRGICSFADYFVILTGDNERQMVTVAEEIEHIFKNSGVKLLHEEGTPDSGWILLDFGDVIIHIFAPAEREYYQLDQLWSQAKVVLRVQ